MTTQRKTTAPPIQNDANDFSFKRWFNNVFLVIRSLSSSAAGFIGINTITPPAAVLSILTPDAAENGIYLETESNVDSNRPNIEFRRGRGTPATKHAVLSGDYLGFVRWRAYNTTLVDYSFSADIYANADGAPAGNFVPGRLIFATSDGTGLPSERVRITGTGLVGIHQTIPVYQLDVGGDINTSGVYRVGGVPLTSGAMVLIQKAVTAGSQATVNISSIPATYNNLKIVVTGRNTAAATDGDLLMQLNGDTVTTNYTDTAQQGSRNGVTVPTLVVPAVGGNVIGLFPGGASTTTALGVTEILIANYAGTVFHKVVEATSFASDVSTTSGLLVAHRGFRWLNTAAITSVLLRPDSGNFLDGSTICVYGF